MKNIETYTQIEKGQQREFTVWTSETFLSDANASLFIHGKMDKPDGRDVTLKFSTTGYISYEYSGLSILYREGVNVPEPIALVDRDQHPKTGIIMGRVFGQDFTNVSSVQNRILLGKEAKKTNSIQVPGFGYITDYFPQFQSAREQVRSEIGIMMPHIQRYEEAENLLMELWSQVSDEVAEQEPRFIHRDLKGRNVMVDNDGKVILVDLEYWNGGDPLWDVGGYLFYILRSGKSEAEFHDFLEGYTDGKEPEDGEKLRILFYTVLSAGRFVELVSRVDPANIDYATNGLTTVVNFVKAKLGPNYEKVRIF